MVAAVHIQIILLRDNRENIEVHLVYILHCVLELSVYLSKTFTFNSTSHCS